MMELYSIRGSWVEKARVLPQVGGGMYLDVPPEPWKAKGHLPKHWNMMLDLNYKCTKLFRNTHKASTHGHPPSDPRSH